MSRAVTVSTASGNLIIRNARVVFEPSAYDNAEATRKNLVLSVDDATIDTIQGWESQIDNGRLSSALSQYGLRVKMVEPVVWKDKQQVAMPPNLRNKQVNAAISLSGIWHTKKQDGLCLQVTDIEFLDDPEPTCPF